ncbi:CheR family methyltransferase [Spirochaeta isovalerica]|uniref:protein-glutamate O-methyltransferase n=1 Tax=Spirochaeta isovalerica TaxID=150 RepID=A0A841RCT5_9SPIO|nr:protein-glutamate O-methyltransferase [Spirochaeta isovalerica]MBB6481476.1 chemotaxis protein methyltransferase CheR [Spirochaeta isovalerica]
MIMLDINDREFKKISELVYSRFGINLTEKKKALVRGRLNKLIVNLGFTSFSQYFDYVQEDKSGQRLLDMVDKISTNHSYFFRESDHFSYLTDSVLPAICHNNDRRPDNKLRIWCAGCANGQEAYTLAMVVNEFFTRNNSSLQPAILATDISISALETAVAGHYTEEGLSGIPAELKRRYFDMEKDGSATAKKELKDLILFKRLNFMNDSFPFKNRFDVVFCRNVMIYFDNVTKETLVNKFHRYMLDTSWLFIGHSETLGRNNSNFKYIKPSTYLRVGANG